MSFPTKSLNQQLYQPRPREVRPWHQRKQLEVAVNPKKEPPTYDELVEAYIDIKTEFNSLSTRCKEHKDQKEKALKDLVYARATADNQNQQIASLNNLNKERGLNHSKQIDSMNDLVKLYKEKDELLNEKVKMLQIALVVVMVISIILFFDFSKRYSS